MVEHPATCIYCAQSDQNLPLLLFLYQGVQFWICPQHLPILIHKPEQLAAKLPGIALISPSGDHS